MKKLWGGRFNKKTNELVEKFSNSIHFDSLLARYDCVGSLKHIDVLKKAKLLTTREHQQLSTGLNRILKSIKLGRFKPDLRFEDIHSYIQHLLESDKKIGKAALKLHTCRSRNDQVLFDIKLYCLINLLKTEKNLMKLLAALRSLAEKNKDLLMPGFTHMQHAMPVKVKDMIGAYHIMLERDEIRLLNAFNGIELTLGSGAIAGTMIPADSYNLPQGNLPKKISAPDNSIATVSDRDFAVETLSALAIIGMHLSRMCEDMILWTTREFNFIDIDEAFCTGSSLMPQKKNPDVLELVRGSTGRLYGNLLSILVVLKGLPLSYNRDMQHDKEPLFDSFKIVQESLDVLAEMMPHVTFNEENLKKELEDECLYATDIADFLVQQGVPFKTAHALVGQLIQLKLKSKKNLVDMPESTLKEIHPALTQKAMKTIVNAERSVNSKKSVQS
ncbi:MAG: argininosuccinate lyase [Candidatus Omnitrophota bacterium]